MDLTFPHYEPPANPHGVPVADPSHGRLLMKAIKTMAKTMERTARGHRKLPKEKKGLTAKETITIKPGVFY